MLYGTATGDRLIEYKNYPDSIKEYLIKEEAIIRKLLEEYDMLIEVGCMQARNIDIAKDENKKYIGIDIVSSYIDSSKEIIKQKNYEDSSEAICLDANYLKRLLEISKFYKLYKSIIYFPFNSFGNMDNPQKVIDNFKYLNNSDFIIFSYDTDEKSDLERKKYYQNCNYENLKFSKNNKGSIFTSSEGLGTMAYNEDYLKSIINKKSLKVKTKKFSDIGLYYYITK